MKKIKEKNITLDELAIMVQKGFMAQDKRIDEVIRTMQEGFKETDQRFTRLEKAVLELKSAQETTHDRLNAIEKVLGPLMLMVDVMNKNNRDHEIRIARLEKKLLLK